MPYRLALLLVWDQPPGGDPVDGYHVWRKSGLDAPWQLMATVSETQCPVIADQPCEFFTVSGFNGGGETWAGETEPVVMAAAKVERLLPPKLRQ